MTGMSAECGQSAPSSPNGSFCQERMFIVADLNDRLWVDSGRKLLGLIPKRIDHDPCAHWRMPMDMMRHG